MLLSIVLSTVLLFVSFSIGLSYESAQRKMAKGMYGTATISVQSKNSDILTNLEDIPDLNAIKSKVGVLESSAIYNKGVYYEEFSLISADLSQLNKINKPRLENGDSITDFSGDCRRHGSVRRSRATGTAGRSGRGFMGDVQYIWRRERPHVFADAAVWPAPEPLIFLFTRLAAHRRRAGTHLRRHFNRCRTGDRYRYDHDRHSCRPGL